MAGRRKVATTPEGAVFVPAVGATDPETAARYEVAFVPLSQVYHPDWNPGSRHQDASLADSIREVGVQSPVLVRPLEVRGFRTDENGHALAAAGRSKAAYEVVAGNRRVAGARAAGLEFVPAFIRELTREEAIKLCGVENLQRQDLSPLEEADWLRAYAELPEQDVETTAATFGRTVRYVAGRIRVSQALAKEWKTAHAGKGKHAGSPITEWPFGHLDLVARLERAGQLELLERATQAAHPRIPTAAELREWIDRLTRVLTVAPWDLDDAALVKRKPCTGCPSRSDAQATLWDAEVEGVRCLDVGCWKQKLAAWRPRRLAELAAEHGELVAWSRWGSSQESWEGLKIVGSDHEVCKKKAPGARPAVELDWAHHSHGQHLVSDLKVVWIRKRGRGRGASASASEASTPRSLEEKRAELDGRRAVIAAERIVAELGADAGVDAEADLEAEPELDCAECGSSLPLDAELCPGCGADAIEVAAAARASLPAPAPASAPSRLVKPGLAVALALVFGCARKRDGNDWGFDLDPVTVLTLGHGHGRRAVDPWEVFDAVQQLDQVDLLQTLWEVQIRPVLLERLKSHDTSLATRQRIRREAERICELVGADFETFWQAACEAKPEPRSWTRKGAASTTEEDA